jgi:hypothetical protein
MCSLGTAVKLYLRSVKWAEYLAHMVMMRSDAAIQLDDESGRGNLYSIIYIGQNRTLRCGLDLYG